MSKGAPDYSKLVLLTGLDADGNQQTVLLDSQGHLITLIQGAVDVSGEVDTNVLNTVREIQGKDGTTLRTLAVDASGRIITVIQGAVDISGEVDTNVLNTVREIQGKDGTTLRTLAVDASGRIITVIQGAVDVSGSVNANITNTVPVSGSVNATVGNTVSTSVVNTVREIQGSDGATLRTLALDTSGRILAVMKGQYSGALYTLATDADGKILARLQGRYGNTMIDVAVDANGRLLQASVQDEQRSNAAMDETTYSDTMKSGSNYVLGYSPNATDSSSPQVSTSETANYVVLKTITATATRYGIQFEYKAAASGNRVNFGYTINSSNPASVVVVVSNANNTTYLTKQVLIAINTNDVVRFWVCCSDAGNTAYLQNASLLEPATTGSIKSNAIVASASLLLYWRSIRMNLSKSGSTHATPLRIKFFGSSDSYAAALNANWVTIPEAEYGELILQREIIKTATGNSQTVWDFTSLTSADALINEIGCYDILLIEKSLDGTNYTALTEYVDYLVDLTSRIAPRITLLSGTGIVSGTSKLCATMVVDVLKVDNTTKNTSIKVQIQENRATTGQTSPTIQPLPTDPTTYVSGIWVLQ